MAGAVSTTCASEARVQLRAHTHRMLAFRDNLATRERSALLVDPNIDTVTIDNERSMSDCRLLHGHMRSPLARHVPDFIPSPVRDAV